MIRLNTRDIVAYRYGQRDERSRSSCDFVNSTLHMERSRFLRYGVLCCLIFLAGLIPAIGNEVSIEAGVKELNAGRLMAAKTIFGSISTNSPLHTRAIALKHLGTTRFRLGDKAYRTDFEMAEKLLQGLNEYREEYGRVLYQKANCLLSDFENALVEKRVQGTPAIPFSFIRDYIHPAVKATDTAVGYYPQKEFYDIDLLEIDLHLSEARVWLLCNQIQTAGGAYRKAFSLANQDIVRKDVPPDALKKIKLRYATILLECPKDEVQTWDVKVDALSMLRQAIKIESGNKELDYAVQAFYLHQLLHTPEFQAHKGDFQKELLSLAESVEKLNVELVGDLDYIGKKSYFAMRTAVYEVMMEYYAITENPFAMLLAMNKMRSRALQATMDMANDHLSEAQLKAVLKRENSLLVSYFVGADSVWMVGFSQYGGEILKSKRSGREIVSISKKVVQTFSNPTRLFMFCRRGGKAIPEAYALSHELYLELLSKWHEKFKVVKASKIFLMPSNYLNYLPFAALVTEIDSENIFRSKFIAHEGIPICYMPILSDSKNNSIANLAMKRSVVLARGDYSKPAYYYNNEINCPDRPIGEPLPLPGAIKEGQDIAKLLQVSSEDFLQDAAASEFNLLKKTERNAKIVHIASHAHLYAADPLSSYVVLSAGDGEDGKVTVEELFGRYRMRIKASLLTLSACNTNRGEDNVRPGDDIAALSSAFLVAGAKSVIATQWPASDETFPQIMTTFYENYTEGKMPEEALSTSLRSYLNDNAESIKVFPLFWGNIATLRSAL